MFLWRASTMEVINRLSNYRMTAAYRRRRWQYLKSINPLIDKHVQHMCAYFDKYQTERLPSR